MFTSIGSLVLRKRQAHPRRPPAVGVFDCSCIIDGLLEWIKFWILPDPARGRKTVPFGLTAQRIHCGAVVSISGHIHNGLMKCPIVSDPPFDDLKPLKWMPGSAGRARVGTGRDNKSWSRMGFGFGSQDAAQRHAMLITRCGKVGGGANICRNMPAAKKTRSNTWPAGGKSIAAF